MKLSRRSLFSLALAAPAAAAAVPAKAAEPPITMRPMPECCRLPMVCIERWENARCARYRCGKCGRVAMVSDLSLEYRTVNDAPPKVRKLNENEDPFERVRHMEFRTTKEGSGRLG